MRSRTSQAALLIVVGATTASAFAPPTARAVRGKSSSSSTLFEARDEIASFDPLNLSDESASVSADGSFSSAVGPIAAGAATTAAFWASSSDVAGAAGPDWGIFEGRTGSLLHPVTMASMFLLSLSTGVIGLQWRRQRTLGDDISALKKTLPDLGGASSVSDAIAKAEAADEVDAALVSQLKAALPKQAEIDSLVAERKDLASKGLRDQHYSQGALLAFLGTAFAIEGPLNTYARAGKLFPGPHLYAGAGLVVLWAAAAACVPAMQKGNDTARSLHIALNTIGTGLFGWQVVTGWPILLKVVELTKWP